MRVSCLHKCVIPIFVILILSIYFPVPAQYQLYNWINFEKNKMPDSAVMLGNYYQKSLNVVDYSNVPNMPPQFHGGSYAREVGNYGLQLKGHPDIYIAGVADNIVLDRDRLGQRGRALYQADFYMPMPDKPFPSLAVLAMEPLPPDKQTPQVFYRFGFTRNRFLYFSMVVSGEEEARIFVNDTEFMNSIPRPGWHRFAIVFEGPNVIRCYIDGKEPSFSPLDESTIRRMQVGILLAERDDEYMCYVDNLSIQWTPEDVPIPQSPYLFSWGEGVPDQRSRPFQPVTSAQTPDASSTNKIQWYETSSGWSLSQSTKRPMFVYFHAPNVPAVQKLDRIFQSNPSAISLVNQYVPIKIDVNQLAGGDLARKFRIFKYPTVVILNHLGKETDRAIFGSFDTWDSFSGKFKD